MRKIVKMIVFLITAFFALNCISAKEVVFEPISFESDIQVDSHYIFAVYNNKDHNWYALAINEDGSSTSIKIDNPKNGLTISSNQIKKLNYIYTCPKKPTGSTAKFRSNVINEEQGKKYSLYLRNGIYNLGGVDIHLYKTKNGETNLFQMNESEAHFLMFNSDTSTFISDLKNNRTLYLYDFNENVDNSTYSFTSFFTILSDLPHGEYESKEANLYLNTTLAQASDGLIFSNEGSKFQFVYTDTDGKKYILTQNGTKEITTTNGVLNTSDYIYLRYFTDKQKSTKNDSSGNYSSSYISAALFFENEYINSMSSKVEIYADTSVRYASDEYYNSKNHKVNVMINGKYLCFDSNEKVVKYCAYANQAGWFEFYTDSKPIDLISFKVWENNSILIRRKTTRDINVDSFFSSVTSPTLGFSSDKNVNRIVSIEDMENIVDFDKKTGNTIVRNDIIQKYKLISKTSEVTPDENGEYNIYAIKLNENIKNQAFIGKVSNKNVIGVADFKNVQEGKTTEDNDELYQGSINIEVYKDGKLWLNKDKVYYKYHNDNSADLNIKFINDDVSDINSYLLDKTKFDNSKDNLVIVGIYAQQGGSEEGLFTQFNWVSENGAQLDNVRGGSTVKIYLTSKYTSKYYLNDELYKTDEYVYVPYITKQIIKTNSKNSDYVVNKTTNSELFNKSTTKEYFKEDNMIRGNYSTFSYEILDENDLMNVKDLPNEKLKYNYWIVKNDNNSVIAKANPKENIRIEAKENVNYLYIGDDDQIDTIHLYAYTENYNKIPEVNNNIITISGKDNNEDDIINPKTGIIRPESVIIFSLISGLFALMVFGKNKSLN